jgi:hypothetical protein
MLNSLGSCRFEHFSRIGRIQPVSVNPSGARLGSIKVVPREIPPFNGRFFYVEEDVNHGRGD